MPSWLIQLNGMGINVGWLLKFRGYIQLLGPVAHELAARQFTEMTAGDGEMVSSPDDAGIARRVWRYRSNM